MERMCLIILERTKLWGWETDEWLLGTAGCREGLAAEGNEGTLRGDGSVLYLDYSGGYRAVCVCQNS